uniref:L-seryl-tRNA(Sec) selenium transferase n=1 Tax=uncultured bacterium BAC10-10 TaxID=333372 RepID=Q4JIN0_9BACT|nr:selenocysteine synthase [uncultured bacterium BAC10-10]
MKPSRLRAIPSVDKVLQSLGDVDLPRPMVLDVVRRELMALRAEKIIPDADGVLARIRSGVAGVRASRIRPVINGTGILVHTNLGRAPLGTGAMAALSTIGSNYSNLEYSLASGGRSGRAAYLERGLAVLCEADAATVVNNNAAALVLILRHFCTAAATEVVISRGELVQIGGGFRIPDVLESSGARLREVGTTNQTSLADYARAITRQTAMVLKVHRSNFFMDGFVESPPTEDVAALAKKRRVPFVEDLGSGAAVKTESVAGLEHEPTPAEVLRRGVDLVCFSGDKLLGGPQAGVIAGRGPLVAALKKEPFFRALRCDKLILSALEATVDGYLRGERSTPVLEMLDATIEALRARAERIVGALGGTPLTARVGAGHAQLGGGTLPRSRVASVTIDVTHRTLKAQDFAARLREQPVPVIGYIARGVLRLDVRTIFPQQDLDLVAAIRGASAP